MQCVAAALCCLPATSIAASEDPKELERVLAKIRSDPMIFVVATGEPNACGRGCSEWIAGQGQFDEGAAQRFREFLAVLAQRDLPIFFHSDGGLVSQAVQIGLLLRENRMTAGVARTVPEGCHLGVFDQLMTKKPSLVVKFSTLGLSANIAALESKCASTQSVIEPLIR